MAAWATGLIKGSMALPFFVAAMLPDLSLLMMGQQPDAALSWQHQGHLWLRTPNAHWTQQSDRLQIHLEQHHSRLQLQWQQSQQQLAMQEVTYQLQSHQWRVAWQHWLDNSLVVGLHESGVGLGLGRLDQYAYMALTCPPQAQRVTISWQQESVTLPTAPCAPAWHWQFASGDLSWQWQHSPQTGHFSQSLRFGSWHWQSRAMPLHQPEILWQQEDYFVRWSAMDTRWRQQQISWQGQNWWLAYAQVQFDGALLLTARLSDEQLSWLVGGRQRINGDWTLQGQQLAIAYHWSSLWLRLNLLLLDAEAQGHRYQFLPLVPLPRLDSYARLDAQSLLLPQLSLAKTWTLSPLELQLLVQQYLPVQQPTLYRATRDPGSQQESEATTRMSAGAGSWGGLSWSLTASIPLSSR